MPNYRVIYEIDIEADNPIKAAKDADYCMQKKNRFFYPVFKVRSVDTGETYWVDLDDETCVPLKSKKKAK